MSSYPQAYHALRRSTSLRLLAYTTLAGCIALGLAASLPQSVEIRDFGSFVAAGRALAAGQDPYAASMRAEPFMPNMNPPILLPFCSLAAAAEPLGAFRVWWATSVALYGIVILQLARAYPERFDPLRLAWLLSLGGLWHTLFEGQIYLPLLILAIAAWAYLRRGRTVPAGLLIGLLCAFKPNFLIWPAALLLAGHRRPALVALATTALGSAVPLAFYGWQVYVSWWEAMRGYPGAFYPINASLWGFTARLELPWLGAPLAFVLLAGLGGWAWRRRPDRLRASEVALPVGLLSSPLTWPPYTLFLLPALFGRRWSPLLTLGAALLSFPAALILLLGPSSPWHVVVLGSVYTVALIAVTVALSVDHR